MWCTFLGLNFATRVHTVAPTVFTIASWCFDQKASAQSQPVAKSSLEKTSVDCRRPSVGTPVICPVRFFDAHSIFLTSFDICRQKRGQQLLFEALPNSSANRSLISKTSLKANVCVVFFRCSTWEATAKDAERLHLICPWTPEASPARGLPARAGMSGRREETEEARDRLHASGCVSSSSCRVTNVKRRKKVVSGKITRTIQISPLWATSLRFRPPTFTVRHMEPDKGLLNGFLGG